VDENVRLVFVRFFRVWRRTNHFDGSDAWKELILSLFCAGFFQSFFRDKNLNFLELLQRFSVL